MLNYAMTFFVVALIASFLGFSGVAGLSTGIGWKFAALAIVFLAVALFDGHDRRSVSTP